MVDGIPKQHNLLSLSGSCWCVGQGSGSLSQGHLTVASGCSVGGGGRCSTWQSFFRCCLAGCLFIRFLLVVGNMEWCLGRKSFSRGGSG